jgi:hypothetical protein
LRVSILIISKDNFLDLNKRGASNCSYNSTDMAMGNMVGSRATWWNIPDWRGARGLKFLKDR